MFKGKRYLTPTEASEYTGIPYESLVFWFNCGQGPATVELPAYPDQQARSEEANWRYDIHDLDEFLEEYCKVRPTEMPEFEIIQCNVWNKQKEAEEVARKAEELAAADATEIESNRRRFKKLKTALAALCELPVYLNRLAASAMPAVLDYSARVAKLLF